jgi:hypothetical protein
MPPPGLKKHAERCLRLAKQADPLHQRRLMDLAADMRPEYPNFSRSLPRHHECCAMANPRPCATVTLVHGGMRFKNRLNSRPGFIRSISTGRHFNSSCGAWRICCAAIHRPQPHPFSPAEATSSYLDVCNFWNMPGAPGIGSSIGDLGREVLAGTKANAMRCPGKSC